MLEPLPRLLQLTDSLSGRRAALRLPPEDGQLTLGQLLDKYLLGCPADFLRRTGAATEESLRSWQALQDLVYLSDDRGNLSGMLSGVVFKQRGRSVDLDVPPAWQAVPEEGTPTCLVDLVIDRLNVGYHRNWAGFHRRRWNNDAVFFAGFVHCTLESAYGSEAAEWTLRMDTAQQRLRLVHALARRIWESDFENYSRFTGEKLMFKAGDETVRHIAGGAGGICAEKVQALKFLTDHYGLDSEYLIAGDGAREPAPATELREMLNTFDFRFAQRFMRYWQHTALLYHIDGQPLLVDATNGNIPFLFLQGDQAERLLGYEGKKAVPVRMVESQENYYYHRISQDIPENLFFAMEGWMTDTDMVQVFENELGLYLSQDFYVTPLPYRNGQELDRLGREYLDICRRAGFRGEVNPGWTLDTSLGRELAAARPDVAEKLLAAKEHLLLRYNEWDLPGHDAGLVLFRLSDDGRAGA